MSKPRVVLIPLPQAVAAVAAIPKRFVAKRGTYCEAYVPTSTYFGAHPCEKKHGLQKLGGLWLCAHHRRKGE